MNRDSSRTTRRKKGKADPVPQHAYRVVNGAEPVERMEACKCNHGEAHRVDRAMQALEESLTPCSDCGNPIARMPMPTGPVAPPLMRLRKCGPGVIGYPWLEVISIAPGDPNRFYDTTRYLCRLPEEKFYIYKWFTHTDLYGDGGDYGEYEEG